MHDLGQTRAQVPGAIQRRPHGADLSLELRVDVDGLTREIRVRQDGSQVGLGCDELIEGSRRQGIPDRVEHTAKTGNTT
jgi:hypothetical protein